MNKKITAVLTGIPFLVAAGLAALYLCFGYLAVNPLAQRLLPWVGEKMLASRITVGAVAFDPLSLELTISDVRLSRPDGSPLAGFGELYADLQVDSLFRFAWHVRDIRITRPEASVEIGKDGTFNWADLLAALNKDSKPSATIPRVVIDRLRIVDGKLAYAELSRAPAVRTALAPLALELGHFSTLPEDRGDYLVAADLAGLGGTLRWKGNLGVNPVASAGSVELQGLKLAALLTLVRQPDWPLTLAGGELSLRFGYDFAIVAGKTAPYPQLRLQQVAVTVADVAGELKPGSVVTLQGAGTTIPAIDLQLRDSLQWQITPFDVAATRLQLRQAGVDLLTLGQAEAKHIAYDAAQARLRIASVRLDQGALRATRLRDGGLDWQQALPASHGPASERAAAARPLHFEIADLRISDWTLALDDHTFARPLHAAIGRIDAGLQVSDAGDGLRIDALAAELTSLSVQADGQPQPAARVARIALSGGALGLKDRSARLSELKVSGLQTAVVVNADKSLNWLALLQPARVQPAATAPPKPSDPPAGPGWQLVLDRLQLDKAAIRFEDKRLLKPLAIELHDAMVEMRGVSLDPRKSIALTARLPVRQGGQLDVRGKLSAAPLRGELQLTLAALALQPFSPYLSQFAMVNLTRGKAAAHGRLSFRAAQEFSARFNGGFHVGELEIAKESDGAVFLSWDALSSDSLSVSLAPNRVRLNELRIVHPTARFIIYEDKTVNLQRLLRAPAPGAAAASAVPVPARAAAKGQAGDFPFTLDRLRISDGDLEFADLSLRPQFGAHIHYLDGVINGLSTDAAGVAQVELDGRVDDYGTARVRGSVQPFRVTDFTDLKVEFRNLEMNRLTPYSGKFAGRKIESGKLSVDLEYKLKQRQLAGENKFVINKIKLGERVDSRAAVNLPLDLAIALLEDSNGVIDIDLPITGSLDDPQFSYGKIIWKAIFNVIEKVVTAPFRAIGKLLGISADKLEAISFDPGSAALAPPELEKLKSVAAALDQRPALVLQVVPAFDAAADQAALQELATRRDVAAELGMKLKPGEPVGPLDLSNVKVQTAIDNLLKDRAGQKRNLKLVDTVKDYFRTTKPEDLPKQAAQLERLKATVKVSEAELAALAASRAQAIRARLMEAGALDGSRVTVGDAVKIAGGGKSVDLKMMLGTRSRQ